MDELLKITKIEKHFGGTCALKGVDICVKKSSVHAIVGENGAGKSTLMKIISGVITPDIGTLTFNLKEYVFRHPKEAENAGIAIVHQEPNYFPDLTVLENIFIGKEEKNKFKIIEWNKMRSQAKHVLNKIGLSDDILYVRMQQLPIGTQQMVLIARAVYRECKVIIFDEPTSILSYEESKRLFEIIKVLKESGTAVLYISHRLEEIFLISDYVSVLKNGALVKSMSTKDTNPKELVNLMSGKDIISQAKGKQQVAVESKPLLEVKNVSHKNVFEDISFSVRKGEILGFYGLVGSGRTELAQSIIGERSLDSGEVFYKQELLHTKRSFKRCGKIMEEGIVYLPEDRKTQGIFEDASVLKNMSAGLVKKLFSKFNLVDTQKETKEIEKNVKKYSVKIGKTQDLISSLSGGNQQKVLFIRSLLHNPQLFILDEPTRGIDVGTKEEIYSIIRECVLEDMAIILISSELPELLSLADRVVVMHEGKIMGQLSGDEVEEAKIIRLALGVNETEKTQAYV